MRGRPIFLSRGYGNAPFFFTSGFCLLFFMSKNSILCFYHAPCNDGATAAAALDLRLRAADPAARIEYLPMSFTLHWDDPFPGDYLEQIDPHHSPVSAIYIVDISMSPTKYNQLLDYLREIGRLQKDEKPHTVCIDHHRTAIDSLEAIESYCDDTMIEIGPGLSGATLVWKYFNERRKEDLPTPLLLRYVADQDVWEWKLEDSKAINSALNTLNGQFETMKEELEQSLEDEAGWLQKRRSQGEAILSVINAQVQKSYSRVLNLEGPDGLEIRVVNSTENASELGNDLCEESDSTPNAIAWIYTIQRDWSIKCSLRSIPGGTVTARAIAERFGGGGHDHAAGCRFTDLDAFRKAVEEVANGTFEGGSEE